MLNFVSNFFKCVTTRTSNYDLRTPNNYSSKGINNAVQRL